MRVLLIGLLASALFGQTIRIETATEAVPLAGIWKQQSGDDPGRADPAFDDSGWNRVEMPAPSKPGVRGYTWYRIRVELPEGDRPLVVAIGPLFPAYQIFANGRKIGAFGGDLGTPVGQYFAEPAVFPLPRSERNIVLAIRSFDSALFLGGKFTSREDSASWIGPAGAVAGKIGAWRLKRIEASGFIRLICAGLGFGGLFFLLMLIWRRGHTEYFWCGVMMIAGMVNRVIAFIPEITGINRFEASILTGLSNTVFWGAWLPFLCALFKTRASLVSRVSLGLGLAINVSSYLPWSWIWLSVHVPSLGLGAHRLLPSLLTGFVPYYEQGWRTLRNRQGYGTAHLAIILYLVPNFVYNVRLVFATGPATLTDVLLRTPLLFFLYAMGVILHQRATRVEVEQRRLSGELESARLVQQMLFPTVSSGGVEGVYHPASEVGGDFWQALPIGGGGTLVVLGDVSGKGLKAAMIVSLLTGALRNRKSDEPGAVLDELNAVALSVRDGGFVTAVAARIGPDGQVRIAGAGHPAPMVDGAEVSINPELPLGIDASVRYAEHSLYLEPGGQMTLVSDGVVEAENAKGELFGFERTREISGKSAGEIAEAARAWGQNDDITVVTVRRAE